MTPEAVGKWADLQHGQTAEDEGKAEDEDEAPKQQDQDWFRELSHVEPLPPWA